MTFSHLSDNELLSLLKRLVARERVAAADSLACMSELNRRSKRGVAEIPSLFKICVSELKMSEQCAYKRVRAVRAADAMPEVYALLREGEINFTTLAMIQPHLLQRPKLLQIIRGKTTREVEKIVAAVDPKSRLEPDRIRVVAVSPPESPAVPSEPGTPLELFQAPCPPPAPTPQPTLMAEIRFSASKGFVEALDRLKALLWHKFPEGRLEDVLFEPMNEFLERRDPARPRRRSPERESDPRARRPPAAVEREVRLRDGQRCAFVDGEGRRCGETRSLELDHVLPWALGGRSDDAANLRLLCRAHNQREMRRVFRGEGGSAEPRPRTSLRRACAARR